MNHCRVVFALGALCLLPHGAGLPKTIVVSLVGDKAPGAPARHGLEKVKAALAARGVAFEETANVQSAHGRFLLVAGLASAAGPASELARSLAITPQSAPESLVIRNTEWKGKPLLLLNGSDDRGLMYSLLETADRIAWAADAEKPLSEVRDSVESPSVADRGVTIFTMQQAQFEDRLHNEDYWARYFDMLARARFNTFQVLFAYEMDGYACPA